MESAAGKKRKKRKKRKEEKRRNLDGRGRWYILGIVISLTS